LQPISIRQLIPVCLCKGESTRSAIDGCGSSRPDPTAQARRTTTRRPCSTDCNSLTRRSACRRPPAAAITTPPPLNAKNFPTSPPRFPLSRDPIHGRLIPPPHLALTPPLPDPRRACPVPSRFLPYWFLGPARPVDFPSFRCAFFIRRVCGVPGVPSPLFQENSSAFCSVVKLRSFLRPPGFAPPCSWEAGVVPMSV
jgi:hypothetical protein